MNMLFGFMQAVAWGNYDTIPLHDADVQDCVGGTSCMREQKSCFTMFYIVFALSFTR